MKSANEVRELIFKYVISNGKNKFMYLTDDADAKKYVMYTAEDGFHYELKVWDNWWDSFNFAPKGNNTDFTLRFYPLPKNQFKVVLHERLNYGMGCLDKELAIVTIK